MLHHVFSALLVVTALAAFSTDAFGIEGDLTLFDEPIEAHRANRAAIRTWQGNVQVLDVRTKSDASQVQGTSMVKFAYREQPYALFWQWDPISPAALKAEQARGLIVDRKFHSLLTSTRPDGSLARTARIQLPDEMNRSPQSQTFDPLYYLGYRGENLAEWLIYLKTNATKLPNDHWSISRDGDGVVLAFDASDLLNRYTIDVAKGGMLESYEAEVRDKNGRVPSRERWGWKLIKVADVWVPDEMTYDQAYYQNTPGGEGRFSGPVESMTLRAIKWKESRVNEAVDPNLFSLDSLGLKPGDMISDTRTGVIYEYGQTQSKKEAGSPMLRYLLIAANVVVVGMLLAFTWRRRRARA